jgi:diguanylate cyclase (GGDEF)-like protein
MSTKSLPVVIGVCTSNITDVQRLEFTTGVCEQAKKLGWKVVIFNVFDDNSLVTYKNDIEKSVFELVDVTLFSGMIVTRDVETISIVKKNIIKPCLDKDIPLVTFNLKANKCHNIRFDNTTAFEHLIDHIIEKHNCKTLNLMAGIKDDEFSELRVAAFKHALKKHGMKFDSKRLMYGQFWKEPTAKCMDTFFASGMKLPDAFICCNDVMAMTVCEKLQEHGYAVPKDVIVTGFDCSEYEKYSTPRLSTIKCSFTTLAESTMDTLKKLIEKKHVPMVQNIQPDIILSQSCGCIAMTDSKVHQESDSLMYLEMKVSQKILNSIRQELVINASTMESIQELKPLVNQYIGKNGWVMLNKSFTNQNYKEKRAKKYFDDEVDCFVNKVKGKQTVKESVSLQTLLPDMNKIFESGVSTILINSLFYKDEVIGYCGCEFNSDVFEMMKIEIIMQTFNEIFFSVRVSQQLRFLINCDSMTGICNRRGFYSKINKKIASNLHREYKLIIYSVDMDGLKYINDTFGHKEGDNAIKVLAKALAHSMRKDDIAARFGGDEFVVAALCKDLNEKTCIAQFKKNLTQFLAAYNANSGKPYQVSTSFGAKSSLIPPDMKIDEIICEADKLMYRDKISKKRSHVRE